MNGEKPSLIVPRTTTERHAFSWLLTRPVSGLSLIQHEDQVRR